MITTDTMHLEQELDSLFNARKQRNLSKELHLARSNWAEKIVSKGLTKPVYLPNEQELKRALRLIASPVFIGGNPRSGTTLLRDLLDGHSAFCTIPSEPLYFEFVRAKVAKLKREEAFELICADWLEKLADPMGQSPYWTLSQGKPAPDVYTRFVSTSYGWWKLMDRHHPGKEYHLHVIPFVLGYATISGEEELIIILSTGLKKVRDWSCIILR